MTMDQLQVIVDAELDSQVLLVPHGAQWHVSHANLSARSLLGSDLQLPEIGAILAGCRGVWEDGVPINLSDVRWPGERRWFDVRIRALYSRVSLTLVDVTLAHQSREALMDSQCRYRLLAENAGDLVFKVSGGRLEWVSGSVRDLLGWDQTDVIGRRVVEFVHPDDQECVRAACELTGGPMIYEARFRHRERTWVALSVEMRQAEDLGGFVTRVGSARALVAAVG